MLEIVNTQARRCVPRAAKKTPTKQAERVRINRLVDGVSASATSPGPSPAPSCWSGVCPLLRSGLRSDASASRSGGAIGPCIAPDGRQHLEETASIQVGERTGYVSSLRLDGTKFCCRIGTDDAKAWKVTIFCAEPASYNFEAQTDSTVS